MMSAATPNNPPSMKSAAKQGKEGGPLLLLLPENPALLGSLVDYRAELTHFIALN